MLVHFIKTILRMFFREGFYSFINILSLSIGITIALIIFLYLQDDLTYDRYHKNAMNIYRVNSIYTSSGKESKYALSPVPFSLRIREEYPEIRNSVRIMPIKHLVYTYGKETYIIEEILAADTTIFEIFTNHFIMGDPATCLRSPNSIVLTEKVAKNIFKDKNPIGEILILNKTDVFEVTGVIQDLPRNVHVQYKAIIPLKKFFPDGGLSDANFFNISIYTFLLLPDNYDPRQFNEKFPAFYDKYAAQRGRELNQQYRAVIQPLPDMHFSNEWQYDFPNGNRTYTIVFLVFGLLVLTLSCINYLNMTTSRAERQRKEIAIRKVLGSKRSDLILQFLGQSILMAIGAMIVSLLMARLILRFTSFNQLIDKNLQVDLVHNSLLLTGVLLLTIIVGVFSGLYPAFYLSRLHPIKTILTSKESGKSNILFRKIMVIMQMTISIGMIICTLSIDRQLEYVRTKDMGINKENLLILPLRDTLIANHLSTLKEKLIQNRSILSVTSAHNLPFGNLGNNIYKAETENGMEENNFYTMWSSFDFIKTMGITLLKGRDFARDMPTDFRAGFIINETLAKKMGWTDPLGKRLQESFGADGKPYYDGVVIGVVKDFNFTSLHNAIEPLVLRLQNRDAHQALVKMDGKNIVQTMKYVEETWNSMSTGFPADYKLMDEKFDQMYKNDQHQNMLIRTFSWICILISCLGLVSLASYLTGNRAKEIIIRKIHGASVRSITLMLYREVLILIIIAAAIASPIAYLVTGILLNDFAYKAGFSINLMLIAVTGIFLLAMGTVSYHSLKIAYSDPVKSLKYE